MVKYNPKEWFTIIFKFPKSDTFQKLLPLMISVGIYCGLVAWLEIYYWKLDQNSDVKNTMVLHSILGFALSMLLVFRTNTAYDRWWEGRRMWGTLTNHSRSISMKLNAALQDISIDDKKFIFSILKDIPVAIKNHLRKIKHFDEFENKAYFLQKYPIISNHHIPNITTQLLVNKLFELKKVQKIDDVTLKMINDELRTYSEVCGACERIRNTPIPFSYSSFIKKFIFFYIMTMPYGLVFSIGWYCVILVPFVLYVLASLELIAEEIENPFGTDANDLPLDDICATIRRNINEIESCQI